MSRRGTSNGNARGNTRDRLARRKWLLETFASNQFLYITSWCSAHWVETLVPTCRCYRCGRLLELDEITVDRIVPGCRGGRYIRGNIRPACADCNSETGGRLRA